MAGAVLLFDGECAFCARCAAFADRRLREDVTVLPWQAVDLDEIGLTVEQATSASQWVDATGVLAGASCVARTLRGMGPGWAALGWLLDLPPLRPLARAGYRAVARTRRKGCRVPR